VLNANALECSSKIDAIRADSVDQEDYEELESLHEEVESERDDIYSMLIKIIGRQSPFISLLKVDQVVENYIKRRKRRDEQTCTKNKHRARAQARRRKSAKRIAQERVTASKRTARAVPYQAALPSAICTDS